MTSFEKVYVPEEEDSAETSLVDGNAYNNTSMLEGKRIIFINTTVIQISNVEAYHKRGGPLRNPSTYLDEEITVIKASSVSSLLHIVHKTRKENEGQWHNEGKRRTRKQGEAVMEAAKCLFA